MLISLNAIKKYVNIPSNLSDTELLELIGSRLVEIEEVTDLAPKYAKSYIVKVVSAEPIEGTHLHLCQIDAGAHTSEYSDTETVQVVCGAPNVHAGMLAVWLAPGAIVPETYSGEQFRLSVRKLRGYESNGMLAALDELDLGTDHEGIVEIDPKQTFTDTSGKSRFIVPGDSFAEVFGLNDLIIDVENKSLTHRPDCFGLIGFAREVAGILGVAFTEPEYPHPSIIAHLPLKVNTDASLCPRYSCAIFELGDNHPSKYLTEDAVFLAKAGMRAIDPMVDLTNIIMLETGQPLHAFDYDKLVAVGGQETPEIIVRAARAGETLQLLDGKTIDLVEDVDIIITSSDIPIALGGAMGGKNTEIDPSTRRVILESATFSLYHLRKTQMAHGIFSEAITRFTKGQPAAMTLSVLGEAISRLGVEPLAIADVYPEPLAPKPIELTLSAINSLLGTKYTTKTVQTTLENVGFTVSETADGTLAVTAPLWRTDIQIKEDVIEEVGRLLGFDNISLALPEKAFAGTEVTPIWAFKQTLRHLCSGQLAMHELLTYSFISQALLEKVGQDPAESYEIVNSISPELQCFRQHIAPSLLDKVRENQKSGHTHFTIYEMNQVSARSLGLTPEGTPKTENHLGIVTTGDFYALKAQLLALTRRGLKLSLEYSGLTPSEAKLYPYLEPAHSASLRLGGEFIGAFGEVKAAVLRRFKLDPDAPLSALELALDPLISAPQTFALKSSFSKFPSVERDITLKVASSAEFGRFYNLIDNVLEGQGLIFATTPASIYQATPGSNTKNLSFHLKFSSPEKTLDQLEISAIMDTITREVSVLGATVV